MKFQRLISILMILFLGQNCLFAQILDAELGPRVVVKRSSPVIRDLVVQLDRRIVPYTSSQSVFGLYNYKGNQILDPEYIAISTPKNGLIRIQHKNGKYGFVNGKGYFRIGIQYDYATEFDQGFCFVAKDYRYGFGHNWQVIDTLGNVFISFRSDYHEVVGYGDSLFVIKMDQQYVVVNRSNEEVFRVFLTEMRSFSDNVAIGKRGEDWVVVDKSGALISLPEVDYINDFSCGYASFTEDGKWGYIDENGKVIVAAYYDAAFRFDDSLAWAVKGDEFVLLGADARPQLILFNDLVSNDYEMLRKATDAYLLGSVAWDDFLSMCHVENREHFPIYIKQSELLLFQNRELVFKWEEYKPHNKSKERMELVIRGDYIKDSDRYRHKLFTLNCGGDVSTHKFQDFNLYENGYPVRYGNYTKDSVRFRKEFKVWQRSDMRFDISVWLQGDFFFTGKKGGRWAIFNESGKQTSDFEFTEVKNYNRNFYLALKPKHIDSTGRGNVPNLPRSLKKVMSNYHYVIGGEVETNKSYPNVKVLPKDSNLFVPFGLQQSEYVSSFFIHENEVSNRMYRQFVHYVRDSIVHVMLGEAGNPDEFGYHLTVNYSCIDVTYPAGTPVNIIWETPIEWDNEEVQYILDDPNYGIYMPEEERFYQRKVIDSRKLNYSYVNDQGQDIYINIYPDTNCYYKEYGDTELGRLSSNYFWHPAYDDYPVVGVSQEQAKAYCYWYSKRIREIHGAEVANLFGEFRLPTDEEWQYLTMNSLKQDSLLNGSKLKMLPNANLNNTIDANQFRLSTQEYGFPLPEIVMQGQSDFYGLYHLYGNVSEWTSSTKSLHSYRDIFNQSFQDFIPSDSWNQTLTVEDIVYYSQLFQKSLVSHSFAVAKGGSFNHSGIYALPSSSRLLMPSIQTSTVGFRLVFSPNSSTPLKVYTASQTKRHNRR